MTFRSPSSQGPPASHHPQRIAIIRPSALGDVCRTVPVLASLRAAYPDATIDWVVQSDFAPAISAHPALNDIISFPRAEFARWWKSPGQSQQLFKWLSALRRRNYDLVLDCQGLWRSGFMAWITGAPQRVGLRSAREFGWLGYNIIVPRHGATLPRHTVDQMLLLVEALGISVNRDLSLYVPDDAATWWRSTRTELGFENQPYAVLAPTSRWLSKRWPIERFAQLIEPLQQRGFEKIVVIGAPREVNQVSQLFKQVGNQNPLVDLVGKATIAQTMAVIAESDLVVANDSAPLHMAVGFDRPCVGLFGPTDPAEVGPYQRPNSIVRGYVPRPDDVINFKSARLGDRLMRMISTAAVIGRIDEVIAPQRAPEIRTRHKPQTAGAPRVSGSARIVPPVWLASRSPRRKQMLEAAGLTLHVVPPGFDDADLHRGDVSPREWVMTLAYLKARDVAEGLLENGNASHRTGTVLGADTVCVAPCGEVLGQPRNQADARRMLKQLNNAEHHTITGVCLIQLSNGQFKRHLFCDSATVRIGNLTDQNIDQYLATGDWRGKAGAYNLSERIQAGWPIECIGDPDTVMGLPMRKLRTMLQ